MSIVVNNIAISDTKETSNNTEQQVLGITVDPDTSGFLTYTVTCQRTSDTAAKSWQLRVAFKKNGSNAPVVSSELLGGILGTSGDPLALLSATATIDVPDNQNINFYVKGLNSTTMIWYARVDGYSIVES